MSPLNLRDVFANSNSVPQGGLRQTLRSSLNPNTPNASRLQSSFGQMPTRMPTRQIPNSMPEMNFGLRRDKTKKGLGYFGKLNRPDGSVSTELSIGVDLGQGEMEIPSLVPTLDPGEIDMLLGGGRPTELMIQKAVEHARLRMKQGLSPFARQGEQASR